MSLSYMRLMDLGNNLPGLIIIINLEHKAAESQHLAGGGTRLEEEEGESQTYLVTAPADCLQMVVYGEEWATNSF
ncbi:unnamed protein product [Pieris macdunnoughi]|uniref:Uncharacterized protein n=1 Tax=Pieris macdunnoughi TaxID=345717 RepID=A0A821VG83_9NEOP|nr:unnamed protein product [Pieris macdunnoughi]